MTLNQISVLISAEPGLMRDSIYTILQSYGYVTALGAEAGMSATLEAINGFHPQVVLVDCSDRVTSMGLLQFLHTGYPEVKLVAIVDTYNARIQAVENGADGALIKGFTGQDLQIVLRKVIESDRPVASEPEV